MSKDPSVLDPANTPLFIGLGVMITGTVSHTEPGAGNAVVLGHLSGDVKWNGTVQVAQGGLITPGNKISCRELVVAGTISGDDVEIEVALLRLEPTAKVDVRTLRTCPGGIEQARGATLTVRAGVTMTDDNPYSTATPAATLAQTPSPTDGAHFLPYGHSVQPDEQAS